MASRHGVMGLVLSLALVCMLALAESLFAQQDRNRGRPSGRDAYESAKARDRNLQNREMAMQHAGDADKKTLSPEQLKALVSQMREDFRRLQIVNNNMMRGVAVSKVLDYKSVEEATDEINKCAKRLQALLPIPGTEDDKKDENKQNENKQNENKQNASDPKQMRPALFRLDDLIMSFVTSPLFKNLVDTENAEKARRDLTGIIDLSGAIRKNAEKLSKASSKS